MSHFGRERIPERVVHAKGAGNLILQKIIIRNKTAKTKGEIIQFLEFISSYYQNLTKINKEE